MKDHLEQIIAILQEQNQILNKVVERVGAIETLCEKMSDLDTGSKHDLLRTQDPHKILERDSRNLTRDSDKIRSEAILRIEKLKAEAHQRKFAK